MKAAEVPEHRRRDPHTSRQKLWKQVSKKASASGLMRSKQMLHTVPTCMRLHSGCVLYVYIVIVVFLALFFLAYVRPRCRVLLFV